MISNEEAARDRQLGIRIEQPFVPQTSSPQMLSLYILHQSMRFVRSLCQPVAPIYSAAHALLLSALLVLLSHFVLQELSLTGLESSINRFPKAIPARNGRPYHRDEGHTG